MSTGRIRFGGGGVQDDARGAHVTFVHFWGGGGQAGNLRRMWRASWGANADAVAIHFKTLSCARLNRMQREMWQHAAGHFECCCTGD